MKNLENNLLVTVSGGRSSAFMARHIQTSKKYKDFNKIFVFANTGMERLETIKFLKDICEFWNLPLIKIEGVYSQELGVGVKYKIVEWDDLDMSAKTFSKMIEHKTKGIFGGLPNQNAPYCSENLKTIPCKKLADKIFGLNNYKTAIGFRKEDMPKRISWAEVNEHTTKIFPLLTDFESPISQLDLNKIYKKEEFRLELDGKFGNCELCWKKSDNNLADNILYGTRFIEWYQKEEAKYGNTSFRGHKSIDDLVKLSLLPRTMKLDLETEDNFSCVCSF